MSFHTSKKHVKATPKSTKFGSCEKKFPSCYSFQQHRKKDHGLKTRKTSDFVANLSKKSKKQEDSDGYAMS